ncbi:lipid binding protein, putative [Ricinus communis]|uniref:Lipid binding protein, putative n=1 Tax=Ricinus communis TaxID=3988 RepID=B9T373_RICCO|nr:lipid binding protein, putative [Ricinus communis]|eukprot:XP_002532692.1 14 kDa proline-rich protein DC2.15 [Ricinus communis]
MASKAQAITAFLLCLNLVFFSMVSAANTCSIDYTKLKLGTNYCSLLAPILDLDAAICLCAAIKAGLLGVVVDADVTLGLLLTGCGKTRPSGFVCK